MSDEAPAPPGRPDDTASVGRPVVIVGMDRSGTSLTASIVDAWGAYGGDDESLTVGNRGNPRGYFEHRAMQRLLVRRLGSEFWEPDYPETLRRKAEDPEVRREALDLMADMRRGGEVWYWKEPLLSVTLPFWQSFWGDRAVYVVVLRDPWKCARSWQRLSLPPQVREQVSLDAAALLRWQVFMRSILAETDGAPRLFLRYERLVTSPEEEVRRLAEFLDGWRGGPGTARDVLREMSAQIDPSLDRTDSEVDFADRAGVSEEQKILWRALNRKLDEPGASIDLAATRPWPGWREYMTNLREFWLLYERAAPLLGSRWANLAARVHHRIGALLRRLLGLVRKAGPLRGT